MATVQFPPIRAFIFDMDGLLINTEKHYFVVVDKFLQSHNHELLPQSLKPRCMGVPAERTVDIIYNWANLPLSRAEFGEEFVKIRMQACRNLEVLPGVKELLQKSKTARTREGDHLKSALASSTTKAMFDVKMSKKEIGEVVLGAFDEKMRVLGDNPGIKKGRGKPAGDIFLLALKAINDSLPVGERSIIPSECLVFEDSVAGVEAGRRAGMRVAWVPPEELTEYYEGKEDLVLAGRVGLEDIGNEEELGVIGDGWGEKLSSLEGFPYERYGIQVSSD